MRVVSGTGRPVCGAVLCIAGASLCILLAVTTLLTSLAILRHCGAGNKEQQQQTAHGHLSLPNSGTRRLGEAWGQPEPPGMWGLAAARAAAAAAAPGGTAADLKIPKIFHRIYIAHPEGDRANYTMPIAHERWIESCQLHYSPRAGWSYMFWDHETADALVANHYPWFLPFYRHNLTTAIEKSDMARYAILHKLGGLYFDSDIECWREGSDFLEGWDIVLQGTHFREGVTNAAIAARPGLEVFTKAMELVQGRQVQFQSWKRVIQRTGPDLLADALVAVGVPRKEGVFHEQLSHNGVAYRVHGAGTFVMPCQWWEQECRRRIYQERISGNADLRSLIGFHRMVGSWIQGKKDGIGIINATAELCMDATHSGPNGLPAGWVVPESRKRPEQAAVT